MSEQWWFVMPFGEYVLPKVQHSESDAISFSLRRGGGMVVRGRIVEDAGPCEWELSPFVECHHETATECGIMHKLPFPDKTWGQFITDFVYKYCPMCGRSLKEE